MALDLALVISGRSDGAKQALADTKTGIEQVGKAASEVSRQTGEIGQALEKAGASAGTAGGNLQSLAREAGSAASELKTTAGESRSAADTIGGIAPAADSAGRAIEGIATAAGGAGLNLGNLKTAALGFIGGIAGGLAGGVLAAAVDGAAEAFGAFAMRIISDTPRINEDLKSHEDLVKRIRGAYAEAEGAASSYGQNSAALLRFQTQQNVTRLERDYRDSLPDGGLFNIGAFGSGPNAFGEAQLGPMTQAVDRFRADLQAGTADVIAFRNEIAGIAETLPADSPFRTMAQSLIGDTDDAAKIQGELARSRELLEALNGSAEAAANALGGTAEKYGSLGEAASSAAGSVPSATTAIQQSGAAAGEAAAQIERYRASLAGAGGVSPSPSRAAATPLDLVPHALGGVVTAPTLFSFDGGKAGIMGEAGDEAILPMRGGGVGARTAGGRETRLDLVRLSDGSLGVDLPTAFASGGIVSRSSAGGASSYGASGYSYGGYGGDPWNGVYSTLADGLRGVLSGVFQSISTGDFSDFWDRFADIGLSISERLFNQMVDQLVTGLTRSLVGGLGGGFGGLGSGGSSQWAAAASGAIFGLFEQGGFTGNGPVDEVGGFVHREEFVVKAPVVAKPGVRRFLQALNDEKLPGFRSGGFGDGSSLPIGSSFGSGSPAVSISVNNYTGQEVRTEESTDARGNRQVTMTIGEQAAAAIRQRGNPARAALAEEFGLKARGIGR